MCWVLKLDLLISEQPGFSTVGKPNLFGVVGVTFPQDLANDFSPLKKGLSGGISRD